MILGTYIYRENDNNKINYLMQLQWMKCACIACIVWKCLHLWFIDIECTHNGIIIILIDRHLI